MPKTKKPSRKTRLRQHLWQPRSIFYLALITALITVGWYVDSNYLTDHPPSGSEYYNNLDISKARQAVYVNRAIHEVKDLGTVDNVKEQVIDFDVPKDNLNEFGLMTLPTTPAKNGQYPVIILCHGYENPRDYSTLKTYLGDMEFYSQHGFAVIKPDYRGQGLSLDDGTADGAYYSMSYNTDVMSLIAAIKKTSYLDKNAINLWGHSMGAYVALRAAVISPDIKATILLSGPVGTPQDMFNTYVAISDLNNPLAARVRSQQLAQHGTPVSNPSYWDATSPLSYLKGAKSYFQIHVGTADKIVPPRFSADLDQALTKAGKAHGYFIYLGGNHGLGKQRSLIWSRSLSVLKT